MKDEIKEILRDLEFASGVFDYTITPDRCTFLKDYITNLQEKYNEYKNLYFSEHKVKEDYKSRNEKAIEYGKELRLFDNESLEFEIGTNFINILQGEDKDVKD